VVWKLDGFGRSLKELIKLLNGLNERGVEIVSLQESLDTATPDGKLIFHVFGAVAEFERDIIRERRMAGLEAARSGRHLGEPRGRRRLRNGSSALPASSRKVLRAPSSSCNSSGSNPFIGKASQPSPRVAARRSAARLIPPSKIGGPLGREGAVRRPIPRDAHLVSFEGPWPAVQHSRSTSIISLVRRPRFRTGARAPRVPPRTTLSRCQVIVGRY
jgi:hypothetical protein